MAVQQGSSSRSKSRNYEIISPSLLSSVKIHPVHHRFSLGMDDFLGPDAYVDSEGHLPTVKRSKCDGYLPAAQKKKSLTLKKKRVRSEKENMPPSAKSGTESTRFEEAFASSSADQYMQLAKGYVPKNTNKCTTWALNNFQEWSKHRNMRFKDEQCPDDLLTKTPYDPKQLCHWLSRYMAETRQTNGAKYPATTLYQLLCGLNRYMRSQDPRAPNLVDHANPEFKELHNTMDSIFRSLRVEGVGVQVKHASVITKEEENLLWSRGVLNLTTPIGLLRAVFFSNGKGFCLRGGKEHRNLKISQFERLRDPDRYVYTENGSKNRSGGYRDLRVENKIVPIYANSEAGDRCHVKQLDLYLSKLPPNARQLDIFYLRPSATTPDDPTQPWFGRSPIGENKLSSMVKDMFAEVGVVGKSNHSLRATGATELYTAHVPEKMIQQRTGHRSLKALRTYERVTEDQELAVSRILTSDSKTEYSEALPKQQSTSGLSGENVGQLSLQQPTLPPGNMLQQMCQVSQNKSFAPNLTSLFGTTSNCVINVNFGQASTSVAFHAERKFEYDFPEEMDKALLSLDL